MIELRTGGKAIVFRPSRKWRRSLAADDYQVDTPADRGQHDREAQPADGDARRAAADDAIRVCSRGLDAASRQAEGTQAHGKQRREAGPGKHAYDHDLPQGLQINPGVHSSLPPVHAAADSTGSPSGGATEPAHSAFTFSWLTALLRDRR